MFNKKGQNIAEYVILVALIIAAAAAMQVYLKRGIQGRMADAVDKADPLTIDGNTLTFATKQYEPYYANAASDVASTQNYKDAISARGQQARTAISQQTTRYKNSWTQDNWNGFTSK